MAKIVISYRRLDSMAIAGRLFDRLSSQYSKESVFVDIDNIPVGADFRTHIANALVECDVLIAVVGPRWLDVRRRGHTTIRDEGDWIRIEVETALRQSIPIIPVLVDGARMPKSEQLPQTLRDFAFRNAITIDSGQDFHAHVDRLVRALDQIPGLKVEPPKRDEAGSANEVGAAKPAATDASAVAGKTSRSVSTAANALAGSIVLAATIALVVFVAQRYWPTPQPAAPKEPQQQAVKVQPAPPKSNRAQLPKQTKIDRKAPLIGEPATLTELTVVFKKGRANWEEAFETLKSSFKAVADFLDRQGIARDGWPITIYTATDDTGFEFQAGFPVAKEPASMPSGEFSVGKSPSGRAIRFVHFGGYDEMDTVYEAIIKYLDDRKIEARDLFLERYVNDPQTTPEENLVIEVYVPIK